MFAWNPNPNAFVIPLLDHPIRWYGLFFAFGFGIAYLVLVRILTQELQKKELARTLVDRALFYVIIGTVVGARLGEVLFYDLDYFLQYPGDIIKVWQGGLASHGGAVGIILALILFYRRSKTELEGRNFWQLFDLFVIPVPIGCAFIRFGNFFNQEIVGTPSNLPWAVLFVHPADHVSAVPRHPVQLYEAAAYLLSFALLYTLWKKGYAKQTGFLTGFTFVLIFTFRFLLEFFKVSQTPEQPISYLEMGQLLSIPFILIGIVLIILSKYNKLNFTNYKQ